MIENPLAWLPCRGFARHSLHPWQRRAIDNRRWIEKWGQVPCCCDTQTTTCLGCTYPSDLLLTMARWGGTNPSYGCTTCTDLNDTFTLSAGYLSPPHTNICWPNRDACMWHMLSPPCGLYSLTIAYYPSVDQVLVVGTGNYTTETYYDFFAATTLPSGTACDNLDGVSFSTSSMLFCGNLCQSNSGNISFLIEYP